MKRCAGCRKNEILKLLTTGPKQITTIMYHTNINSGLLHPDLDVLMEKGLVQKTPKKGHLQGNPTWNIQYVYSLTDKGIKAVKNIREVELILGS